MRGSVALIVASLVLSGCASPAASPVTPSPSPVAAPTDTPTPTPSASASESAFPSTDPSAGPDETVAPDAAGLAFIRVIDGVQQVFLVADDGRVVQLTDLDAETSWGGASAPRWSADGSWLAFGIGLPVGVAVGVMPPEPGEPRIVDGASFPAWSRDGARLAVSPPFDVIGPGAANTMPVSLVDPATGETTEVTTGILPGWHPDGRLIVTRGIADAAGGETPVILAVDPDSGAEETIARGISRLAWSPDGSRVAYELIATAGCPPVCHEVHVAPADDPGRSSVATAGTEPRWSPDGEVLSYGTLEDGPPHVALIELASGHTMDLGPGDATSVTWSPDGSLVAYTVFVDGPPIVRIVDRAGQVRLEFSGESPAWRPTP